MSGMARGSFMDCLGISRLTRGYFMGSLAEGFFVGWLARGSFVGWLAAWGSIVGWLGLD